MKRSKLAIAALLMGIVSFVNLLGLEKGVMAIVIGWMALQEAKKEPDTGGKSLAWAGIVLGIASIGLIITISVIMGPKIIHFFKNLR
ncbi:MAG TPA: DUF4190 domain-containing protein [Bacillota bacterium]|nr:DUF4190 domain-containing protein [Bacillota bacterium]